MGDILSHLYKLYKQPGHFGQGGRWQTVCLGIGFGLLTGAASAQSGAPTNFGQKGAKMPIGSFLTIPAKSVQNLNRELDDPVVMARYAKLFNMPPALVRLALADLKLQPLTEDRNMEVWFVKATRDGEVSGYRLRKVKKGTLVYAMQDGTPALIQVCGNPVRMMSAPGAVTDIANLPEYEPYSLVLGAGGLGVNSDVAVATLDTAPDDFVEVSMPDVPLPVPAEPPQLLAAHAKRLFALWFLPALAAIPAFTGIGGGGGGGGGGSSFLPLPPPGGTITVPPVFTPTPGAVPEPGPVSLLAGLAAGGAFCWRRKRK